jgi:hypothetical protein
MNAAHNGPVVVLNATEERCDALALVDGMEEVIHIPLPDVTYQRITELRDGLKDVLYSNGLRLRGNRAAKRWTDQDESNDCKDILAELWNKIVKPVLDSLAFSVRVVSPFISGLLLKFCPGSSRYPPTYLVVPNRPTRSPPNTCRWYIQTRLQGVTDRRLCDLVIYSHIICPTGIAHPQEGLFIQTTFGDTAIGSWSDLNSRNEARARMHFTTRW